MDLNQLQSITLREWALDGDYIFVESNELIMKSMNDNEIDRSDLPSLSQIKGDGNNFYYLGIVILESGD